MKSDFSMTKQLYATLQNAKSRGEKKFAVLIDPDKLRIENMSRVLQLAKEAKVDFFFIGGSLIVNNMLDQCLTQIREACDIPLSPLSRRFFPIEL